MRQNNNKELLTYLEYLINKYPEQRFSQILSNYGFVIGYRTQDGSMVWANEYNAEPDKVLKRVEINVANIERQEPPDDIG